MGHGAGIDHAARRLRDILRDVTDDLKAPLKLSQQLVMTPQLQMAIRLLGTASDDLQALIDTHLAAHPGTLAVLDGPDPLDDADPEDRFRHLDASPFDDARGDVFVVGNPPQVRANGQGYPRYRAVGDQPEARWLVRALRQRAKTYAKVVEGLVTARPQIATAHAGDKLAPVALHELASVVGMHESTIARVVSAVTLRNLHGVVGLVAVKRGITIA